MGINFVSMGINFVLSFCSLYSILEGLFGKMEYTLSYAEARLTKFVGMFISQITYPDVQYDWLVRIHQSIYFSDFQYDQSNFLSRLTGRQSGVYDVSF